jgi:hypothetical protein
VHTSDNFAVENLKLCRYMMMVSYKHIIKFSASEKTYFTDQPQALNRECNSMNSQLLMNKMLCTSTNCPAVGGMSRER